MRKVEVFTTDCFLCEGAVEMVKDTACPDCEVIVHDLRTQEGQRKAEEYGVSRCPTVVVNGKIAPCCVQGGPDAQQLQALGVGIPLS